MPSKPIVYVSGDKGGVGKSIAALALLDYYRNQDAPVVLVDTDTSNPDVWRCYGQEEGVLSELVTLDEAEGWIALINLCDHHRDRTVIINTAARTNTGVSTHGAMLNGSLLELERPLTAFWVINRQRDSLELLKKFMAALPAATVHVLRNLYWGDEAKFELYNRSTLRKTVEERGGHSLNFPDLADRVADDLFSRRLSIAKALRDLPLGNRAELRRWQTACMEVLDPVLALTEATDERPERPAPLTA